MAANKAMGNHTPGVRRNACPVCVAFALLFCAAIYGAGGVDPSTLNDKVLSGEQGWFTCPSHGSLRWTHWSRGTPTVDSITVELCPDHIALDPNERCEV